MSSRYQPDGVIDDRLCRREIGRAWLIPGGNIFGRADLGVHDSEQRSSSFRLIGGPFEGPSGVLRTIDAHHDGLLLVSVPVIFWHGFYGPSIGWLLSLQLDATLDPTG